MSLPLSNCPMCCISFDLGSVGRFVCDSVICRDELLAVLRTYFPGPDGLARKIGDILERERYLSKLKDSLEDIRRELIELAESIRDDSQRSKRRLEELGELKERMEEIEREEASAARHKKLFERAEALVGRLNGIRIPR